MFHFFRKNYLYSKSIEPHCAYCSHCTKDTEHQGICDLRGIVALAGKCRKFVYNPLMRVPPKPARIRGRFTDEDFFFEERTNSAPPEETEGKNASPSAKKATTSKASAADDKNDVKKEEEHKS